MCKIDRACPPAHTVTAGSESERQRESERVVLDKCIAHDIKADFLMDLCLHLCPAARAKQK